MDGLAPFFSTSPPSLKVCGVTTARDAEELVRLGVPAMGINFWPPSKRFCSEQDAAAFLPTLRGRIVRVGVFVNNARELGPRLHASGALDGVQLHGDESDEELETLLAEGIPTIRSLALSRDADLETVAAHYQALASGQDAPFALLLDAHAPGVYGGTGQTIDWEQAAAFIRLAAPLPVLLAGGIVPENAAEALATTTAAGLDVASGAESAPGVKDFCKVRELLAATR
ncbi:phosphoribosylanthranilate isomerase [Roseibacillus ishigakijimensis]|uniref:N-(5'-phosphoribosyl)anthranilate isomerase n=1 Tax=Roseibacillus ishigakijimensis TaxID=454146 RepID=A0A934VM63_9BACT|nr:phosphoribosylanthranilate isomerase [Roseibacillus ishigakijimensis]MBK1835414.1 phosphoribosylanthranilate isomerase [Roseibacillus ishigakijimensis]